MNDLLIPELPPEKIEILGVDLERKRVYARAREHTRVGLCPEVSSKNVQDLERKRVYVGIHGHTRYRGVGAVFRGVRSLYFKYIRMRFVLLIQTALEVCEHTLPTNRRFLFVIQTYGSGG